MGVLTMDQALKERKKPGELSAAGVGWDDVEPLAEWVGKADLSGNKLTSTAFARGSGVACLMLSKNRLPRLEGLADIPKLKILDVSDNPLQTFAGVEDAEALTAFIAARCPDAVGADSLACLGRLRTLETLVLREAPIAVAALQPVVRIATLTKLSLSHCGLTSLPWGTKAHRLAGLTELRLAHNAIASLDTFLTACKALRILDLGHNRLADADAALECISSLPKLTHLTLQGNPLEDTLDRRYRESVVEACRGHLKYLDNDYATDDFREKKKRKKEEGAARRAAAEPKRATVSFGDDEQTGAAAPATRGTRANTVLMSPERRPLTRDELDKEYEEEEKDVFVMKNMSNGSSTAAKASGLRDAQFGSEVAKKTSAALDFLTAKPSGSSGW